MSVRVVIVEDHAESAEGLAELLAIWGYEPHIASDAERALALVDTVRPDIILSDIGLPGMDGHELARRLREEYGSRIVLVALTGVSDARLRPDSHFDHMLMKPVDLDALERLLENEAGGRNVSS